ncbi:MAG: helix-turn-helix transcriptional regulator [Gammaproteobacteria bacterium]|nr:helix-turn-helix transcriptional regulator [Gammaproteobacteria bacterium]
MPLPILDFIQQLNRNRKIRKNTFQFIIGKKLVPLTFREMECLMYLAEGLPAKAIARKMMLSPRTIEGFSKKLFVKAEVTTRTGLLSKLDYQTFKLFPLLMEAKRELEG